MMDFLRAALELMILLPGMLFASLPMKQYLRTSPARLTAATIPLTVFLCLAGGAAAATFQTYGVIIRGKYLQREEQGEGRRVQPLLL